MPRKGAAGCSTPPGDKALGERRIEVQADLQATAAEVFAVYREVPRWPEWDPDTRRAEWAGPFAVGSQGRLWPRKGLPVRMHMVSLQPDEHFTVECKVLGTVMRFDHELQPLPGQAGGVRVTHRVIFRGWLAAWLDATVGRDVRAGLPTTLAGLGRQVAAQRQR
jgi:Polyketide cyclase / dehydrase and lipid transport